MSKKNYTKLQTEETVNDEVSMEELEATEVMEVKQPSKAKSVIKKVAISAGAVVGTFILGWLCGSKTKKSDDYGEVVYEDEDVTVIDLPSEE